MHSSRMRTVRCSGSLSNLLPCTSPCHACPPALHYSSIMPPPPTTHGPCHTCPSSHAYLFCHTFPPAMHTPPLPCMPPHHAYPPPQCMNPQCAPPVNRMTDACENITFPQLLLRKVIKVYCCFCFKVGVLF